MFHKSTIKNPPPIFKVLQEAGNLDDSEAYRVFNMGVGMVWFVPEADAEKAIEICNAHNVKAFRCGEIVAGTGKSQVVE